LLYDPTSAIHKKHASISATSVGIQTELQDIHPLETPCSRGGMGSCKTFQDTGQCYCMNSDTLSSSITQGLGASHMTVYSYEGLKEKSPFDWRGYPYVIPDHVPLAAQKNKAMVVINEAIMELEACEFDHPTSPEFRPSIYSEIMKRLHIDDIYLEDVSLDKWYSKLETQCEIIPVGNDVAIERQDEVVDLIEVTDLNKPIVVDFTPGVYNQYGETFDPGAKLLASIQTPILSIENVPAVCSSTAVQEPTAVQLPTAVHGYAIGSLSYFDPCHSSKALYFYCELPSLPLQNVWDINKVSIHPGGDMLDLEVRKLLDLEVKKLEMLNTLDAGVKGLLDLGVR